HQANCSPSLRQHWRARGRSVLVPLCGKSIDMIWLAEHGHAVVGCEIAERAIRSFFEESGLEYEERGESFVATELPITIHCGDFFTFETAKCDALYDRAALAALPEERRADYVAQVDRLLVPDAERFVITLEYDQSKVAGPPFSVSPDELRRHWPGLREHERRDALAEAPQKFRNAGLESLTEVVWVSAALAVAADGAA
nr:methyltransferase domain-containing protein [Planctomycetota bacterium]